MSLLNELSREIVCADPLRPPARAVAALRAMTAWLRSEEGVQAFMERYHCPHSEAKGRIEMVARVLESEVEK